MSATSGGGGSVSEGSEAGGSTQSTMSVSDSPSTSFQTNLAENVTKITLSEENGGGSFGADVTGSKINLSLDETQQKDGIVNVAFDYEEGGNRVGVGGGDFRSITGSEKKDKVPEAVNLELVNMVPYSNGNGTSYGVPVNGIPVKKDSEQVDMSTPYDEYFVPVNEHKKYMRGEKLYVTKDKRRPTSWRRCLSWIVACTVISVVLILAILAGTGVILSQEPNLVKEASVGRNFAGSNLKPSVTNKSPTPTAEMYMYVPRSIESEFVIDNLDFDPAFKDVNSTAYKKFAANMEDQLKMFLFDKDALEFGASDVGLKVVNVSRDPFKVNYRIGWNYKQGVNNPPEPIKMEDVKKRLVESLTRNQGYIDKYHIDREAIKVNYVINTCQMDNGGCSHICYYNYNTQQFVCTCPTHLVLDNSGKNCVAWTGSSEDDALPVPSHTAYPGMSHESTANPGHEYEMGARYEHELHHHHGNEHEDHSGHSREPGFEGNGEEEHLEHEPEAEPAPEPTTEPSPGHKDGSPSVYDEHSIDSSHESNDREVAPEPTAEPDAKNKYEHSEDDHSHHDHSEHDHPHHDHLGHDHSEHDHSHHDHSYHDHSGHDVHSMYASKEPTAEPEPEPAPEPTAEENDGDHASAFAHGSKDYEPSAEPKAEPEPAAESTPEENSEGRGHDHEGHSLYGFNDHEPAAEPTPEPAPEPTAEPISEGKDHDIHSVYGSKDDEHAAEPTPEPTSEGKDHDIHSAHGSKDDEHAAEPTPEPTSEGKDHDIHSAHGSKDDEHAAEPTAEPNPDNKEHDYSHHSVHEDNDSEHAAEPTLEPGPEPTPEPGTTGNSNVKDHDHADHSVYESKDHEPTAEPTPEPTSSAESDSNGKNHDLSVHKVHGSSVQEHVAEPTAEPSPESSTEEHAHSIVDLKDKETAPEPTPEPDTDLKEESKLHSAPSTSENKESQPVPEIKTETNGEADPTPEPSPETEINSESNEHTGTTIQPLKSDEQGVAVQDQMQTTEYPTVVQPTVQNESVKENKSMHHVPYLEDILIRKPTPSSGNTTDHSQNPLDNVELTESGKPVIEEIIIDHTERKPTDQTRLAPGHLDEESNPEISTGTDDTNNGVDSKEKSTKISVFATEQKDSDGQKETNQSEIDATTGHPKIIEYNEEQYSAPQDKVNVGETDKADSQPTEKVSSEPTTESNESYRPSEHVNVGLNQTQRPSEDSVSVTGHPEIEHEHQTIPVSVEPAEVKPEIEQKQVESHSNITETTVRGEESLMTEDDPRKNSEVSDGNERPGIIETDPGDDHIHIEDRPKAQETATEPQVAMTTLLSILTPQGIEKITDQLINNKDTGLKEIDVENKTDARQSQLEGHETTKSPEEISNNIKDEISENEEFNTLIDDEYKNIPSEGKETISKYPNKSLKTDKKKLKDYVKGEKTDSDKRVEVTSKPAVTPEDFILQKHVNGNENIYDLDYSLQNEHTTRHEGDVTVAIDPHSIDGVPGVSFKPHGINNHDISVLQTVAPDFRTETIFPTGAQELDTLKPDSKIKLPEIKEGESKTDKDYPKFDKDYKYEKQKVPKKKELKKKIGGKDGKNVELDDGRKYYTEIPKDDLDISNEEIKESLETTTNPSFEKITIRPEIKTGEMTVKSDGTDSTVQPGHTYEVHEHVVGVTELPSFKSTNEETDKVNEQDPRTTSVDQNGHLTIDEPTAKSTALPGTVYDGHLPVMMNYSRPDIVQAVTNSTSGEHGTPGTVFDGISHETAIGGQTNEGNATFMVYQSADSQPKIASEGKSDVNSTTAHPTIIIHGQSGNLQDGHAMRFANSTFINNGNGTVVSVFNGTLTHPDGHSFSFTNYTATFPNGSAVHPTIVVRGQSGTLQDGHQSRFGNATYESFVPSSIHSAVFKNSNVYRIENETLPGTVFDGNFNPQNGHYHMFTNSSGTFVYTNASSQPAFIIRGESGDFGNSTAYIIRNNTRTSFPGGFVGPQSVIFRNSTVFAVENDAPGTAEVKEITLQPHEMTQNETIRFTNQMSPSFVSSGTAYKVNDYFGYISKCAAGQFQCVNGTSKRGSACINLSSKCDSIPDCSDGSDELGCIENGCPGNFQCSDGTCLKRNLVCNGILDCSDESDEKNCENWKCEFDEFQCPSGRCIPIVWQCDGKPDCDNHTDEYNCQTSCGNDEYLCPEGWCIPLTYKCNGVKECSNGEDEQLCDCPHEEFKCHTGGCVSMKHVCNGLDDCPDRSDEWDCVKLEPDSNLLKIRSASGEYDPVCADGWSTRYSDEVCTSLGYFSSVPIESENSSSKTTESSFYVLKNDTTAEFNKKIIVNLRKSDGDCASGKLVEVSCQEFSCGSRSMTDSSSVEARLVGGMSAASGQWPSVALLYNVRNFHSCTANVLTPRWVLASYNCIKMGNKNLNEQDWKFFGGSTVFETEKENAETRKILRIIPHPQVKFNQFLFTNDLALVELDQSLQFTSNLGAVCLPEQEIQPRQICVTAGWGMNAPEDKAIKQQLQYLPVPTMNLTECNSTEHYSGFITDDKICAGYNSAQKSLCYNEEGAPLMCVNDRGEWELQGVLSYHSNCGRGSHPSIFSSITPVSDWIKKTIGNSFERKSLPITRR